MVFYMYVNVVQCGCCLVVWHFLLLILILINLHLHFLFYSPLPVPDIPVSSWFCSSRLLTLLPLVYRITRVRSMLFQICFIYPFYEFCYCDYLPMLGAFMIYWLSAARNMGSRPKAIMQNSNCCDADNWFALTDCLNNNIIVFLYISIYIHTYTLDGRV